MPLQAPALDACSAPASCRGRPSEAAVTPGAFTRLLFPAQCCCSIQGMNQQMGAFSLYLPLKLTTTATNTSYLCTQLTCYLHMYSSLSDMCSGLCYTYIYSFFSSYSVATDEKHNPSWRMPKWSMCAEAGFVSHYY